MATKKTRGKPFKPGHDPRRKNAGRPPGSKSIPDILRRIGDEEVEGHKGMTKLEAVMHKVFQYAVEGNSWAVNFIAERTEGKPVENVKMQVTDDRYEKMTDEELDAEIKSLED